MDILIQLESGVTTHSPEETEELGSQLATALPENCAVALTGNLGTGKTTLVRGMARGLGIGKAVTSPTYNIYTIYEGERQLLHMDAYRLGDSHDLDSLSIEEFLKPPFLIAVEWPEHIAGFLEDYPTYSIELALLPDHGHNFKLVQSK
jgi:tRNA threonylcarbamoyladenosine biosynthesis protein TsaE